jgi:hypothetical protein
MLVVLIDEERYFAETVQAFLEIEGFTVQHFSDASTAFQSLSGRTSIPKEFCMLVDVALAAGTDREMFSEVRTEKYLTTGLVLIDELFNRTPIWQHHANSIILYTAHYTTALWDRIADFASSRSLSVWQKRPNASGAEIVALVQARRHVGQPIKG